MDKERLVNTKDQNGFEKFEIKKNVDVKPCKKVLDRLLQFAREKGITNKMQSLVQQANHQLQKVTQTKGGQLTINKTKRLVEFLKEKGLYNKVMPVLAGVLGYALGEYLVPVTCMDLPGMRPSCVFTTTPIGAGICFPFADLICGGIKYLSAVGSASVTYWLTKKSSPTVNKKSE